ncbi:MAG TPA: DUF2652 domain-containing protein [Flavitalea sp.]|nr:DUF2652 domain-containing protein [Flavitalea sp.]
MENQGLLFIPDISGFTRFVNATEIDHSRLIIKELLELLINANQIGLEISEIEGDAILFYKFGAPPSLEQLYRQVERMFCEFHSALKIYDNTRYCYCAACNSAIALTLKVITHYGEFTGYTIKNFNKLIGKDLIVAHQLLKNDIEQHEYWLVTKSLLRGESLVDFTSWMNWTNSSRTLEAGEIPFHYTLLSELKTGIKTQFSVQPQLSDKTKMIRVSEDFETGIIPLFHATGDFNFRSRWMAGVKRIEEVSHFLPRVGMRCRCFLESGETIMYSSSYSYQDDRIEFCETDERDQNVTHYLLEKIDDSSTRFTMEYYIGKNFIDSVRFKWSRRKKMESIFRRSMQTLQKLVKEKSVLLS